MAKTWYPVIDYLVCAECGACIAKCSHGVFEPAKAPSPVVTNPEACVDHCRGCGSLCPVGAIAYVGNDNGWAPPSGTREAQEACCSCGDYQLPDNLKTFYEGKAGKSACSCGSSCCNQ